MAKKTVKKTAAMTLKARSVSVAKLREQLPKAKTALAGIRASFSEAKKIAKDDRRTSQGRMGLEENKVLRSVIDVMDLLPAVFAVLADEDEGHDPERLETDLLRDRLDEHEVYMTLAEELADAAQAFSDAALRVGALVKPVTLAAYEIAKPLSKRNAAIREKIAPAIDYYSGNATAAAASRAANKAGKNGG